jgi:hypothetical protein
MHGKYIEITQFSSAAVFCRWTFEPTFTFESRGYDKCLFLQVEACRVGRKK